MYQINHENINNKPSVFATSRVGKELDLRIALIIMDILTDENLLDDFQIFEIEDKSFKRKDQYEERNYKLNFNLKEPTKVWAIRDGYPHNRYWTILFPEEY